MPRREIAIYDRCRLLARDLCDVNGDEWVVGNILNLADTVKLLLSIHDVEGLAPRLCRACTSEYCIEIEATKNGFIAYYCSPE